MAEHLATLIKAVDAADSSASLFKAVQNLAGAGLEGAIPTLIAALSYNNPGAAIAAVGGLVKLGDAAVPAILDQLDRHNYTARAWAIRALAEIGDPRGFVILLEAATTDFAVSVRRAATKGLGTVQWHWFPDTLLERSRTEALSALLNIARQDHEWVVRYAAITGLQQFASNPLAKHRVRSQICTQLEQIAANEQSVVVHARALLAQQNLKRENGQTSADPEVCPSPLTETDWQLIQEKLNVFTNSSASRVSKGP